MSKRVWSWIFAILLFNLCFLFYTWFGRSNTGLHLTGGDRFPLLEEVNQLGSQPPTANPWKLVLFMHLDSISGLRNARYAGVLKERFGDQLQTVAVIPADSQATRRLAAQNGVTIPVVADADGIWERALRLGDHPFGVFLVEPSGTIRFASTCYDWGTDACQRAPFQVWLLAKSRVAPA